MAHWPADSTPCAWETASGKPPPVPKPVRHSAARVAWTLVIVLSVTGTGAAAFWQRFGKDVLAVSIAEPHVPPPRHAAKASDAARGERAERAAALAALASGEPFGALSASLAKALGAVPDPLRVEEQRVGTAFDVPERDAERRVEALHLEARAANASLLRTGKGSSPGFERLALLPTTDVATIVQVLAPSGQGVTTAELAIWLTALHAARPIRVLAVGEHLVEGRFEIPARDASEVTGGIYACPGARAPGASGAETLRRRERFVCEFLP